MKKPPILALIAGLLLTGHSFAQPASISVNPSTTFSGSVVTVSGSGFPAHASTVLWLDTNGNGQLDPEEPVFQIPLLADATGTMPNAVWTLQDVPAGSFFIQAGICSKAAALCTGTTGVAQAALTVKLGVSHSKFGSGTTVAVTGFGFSPNTPVNVWYDNNLNGVFNGGNTSASPSTDANGAFATDLLVNGHPGNYFIHAADTSTAATFSIPVNIASCMFQECMIDDDQYICVIGDSPTDLQFLGTSLADCKKVDSNYTQPKGITLTFNPPGGYDLNNVGPQFLGAEVLAAATNDLGPPGTGCVAMTTAIVSAESVYHNTVPDKLKLLNIDCDPPPSGIGLEAYIPFQNLLGHNVPDADFIVGAVGLVGGPAAPPGVQQTVAEAAVAAAIACGHADYYCNGSDITATILENPDLQTQLIPISLLQLTSPPTPNPCASVGVTGQCWGGLIGWGQPVCTSLVPGECEKPDTQGNYPHLPVPGSAGPPDNSAAKMKCATGKVIGLSIGYDGDVSFDVSGPDVMSLVNYHNFEPGPGGSEPPNGLDVEMGLAYRPIFQSTITALRPGMNVHVCGRWVADMHMLWNELHPVTSLSIVPDTTPLTVTANDATQMYGVATPAFTVSYSGFLDGDDASVLGGTLACTTTGTPASPVGSYPITCSGQTSSTYTITYTPGTLTITQAPLAIAANDVTRSYGSANPAFAFTTSGLVNGDTLGSIGVNVACGTSAAAGSPAGSYSITCAGTASSTNYAITYQPGTLTITPVPLTIIANNATRSYGSANPAFMFTASGLVNGDTFASLGLNVTCSTTAVAGSSPGTYPITCSGPASTTNYNIAYQAGTLTITAAPLTIKANDATKLLNAPNPAFSVTYTGFVNGDTAASLTGTLSCTTSATTTSPVGSYPITCSGQSSSNYKITYVPGTLKVLYASSGICGGDAGHQILLPIHADGSSVMNQGRTIPAKFRVCDANGVSVGTAGVVSSFSLIQIIGGTVTDVNESVDATTPDTTFRWDSSGQQWIFNISTANLQAGQTYVYAIGLNDGTSIGFRFGLK